MKLNRKQISLFFVASIVAFVLVFLIIKTINEPKIPEPILDNDSDYEYIEPTPYPWQKDNITLIPTKAPEDLYYDGEFIKKGEEYFIKHWDIEPKTTTIPNKNINGEESKTEQVVEVIDSLIDAEYLANLFCNDYDTVKYLFDNKLINFQGIIKEVSTTKIILIDRDNLIEVVCEGTFSKSQIRTFNAGESLLIQGLCDIEKSGIQMKDCKIW